MATQSGNDDATVRKDRRYSPSSEDETQEHQEHPSDSRHLDDGDVDASAVTTKPGAGGPDDAGEVEVDEEAIRERIAGGNTARVRHDPEDRGVGESGPGEQPRGDH